MRRSPAAISARTARRRELAVTEAAGGRPLALAAAMQSRAAGANAAPPAGAAGRGAGGFGRRRGRGTARARSQGGKSPAPRPAAGLARPRAARLVHGGHGEGLRALRAAAAQSCRTLARLTPARRRVL